MSALVKMPHFWKSHVRTLLLIIIVIPNAYYVDTHIDICCEYKCVNSAHMRIETFEYITPLYRSLILNICILK